MEKISFLEGVVFNNDVTAKELTHTRVTKEIRVCMRKNAQMKEHTAPGEILIMLISGKIQVNAHNESTTLESGDMLYFDARVPHSLYAEENSVIRLTLSYSDTIERVASVATDKTK